ncbi:MAG: fibrillarin-like rRNA/tRNA 2'-O-methyltransferase [Candidatus Bathyarchaeota archaeon]|nr:fibrillarin-like rRNA/tRNA 2'-O-methyltransferase [Candidatus Bathyarchaeota archaeon]
MDTTVEPHTRFKGVYWVHLDGAPKLATKNLTPGRSVYAEPLILSGNTEFRLWNPSRSKLGASILRGLRFLPLQPKHKVLYLGAASGTTASHVSDILGEEGHVYCVEFAARSARDLVTNVCAFRLNMTPILEDARMPEKYRTLLGGVDAIYCDVAQPEQAKILADNAKLFLKKTGWSMLAVKSQSIDVTKNPDRVYAQEMSKLRRRGFSIKEVIQLEPYEKAHAMIVAKY